MVPLSHPLLSVSSPGTMLTLDISPTIQDIFHQPTLTTLYGQQLLSSSSTHTSSLSNQRTCFSVSTTMSKYALRHGMVLSYRAVLSWFFEDSGRPLPSTSPLGHWRPIANVYRYSFQHSEVLKTLTTTTWTGQLFVLTSPFNYVEFNLFAHIMPQPNHQSFHQHRRFNGGRMLCNNFVNCRPHNFIYTFFPSFSPTPYIHARGNIMGGWTSLVEFGLASFFSNCHQI